ncbi:MAG TPA: hypothetical protein VGE26_04565 [Sphingobacteriaceae bacterium]
MWFKVVRFSKLNVHGMALFPFILLREKHFITNKVLINHEKIHLKQQLELLILPFYLLYLLNYLINLVRYRTHFQAYRNIGFEREAYSMEKDLKYLEHRKLWSWIKFL